MSENNKVKANEWFEKAQHDLDSVKLIINASGHADTAAVLLQQSAEKYLRGYLINKGWRLVKTHDLKQLLDEAVKFDSKFNKFYDMVERLSQYYVELKYPFSKIEVSLNEVRVNYEKLQEMVSLH
jgi:HEPN domain-containing protein